MIEFRDFSFTYASSGVVAVKNVNMRIEQGEFVVLAGDSGSGKTTIIRSINGIVPHFYAGTYSGEVRVFSLNPLKVPPRDLLGTVATVLQDPENQLVMGNVEREIAFPLENMGLDERTIVKRVEESLDLLGIYHLRDRKLNELSGGEKQKVAIATALATHPRVLLLDEPTSQVDPRSAEELISILKLINDELGITIIVAEHRMQNLLPMADRLVVMEDGRVVGDGEPRIVASRLDLDSIGVGYPQVSRVARRLGLSYLPFTVKEARRHLCPAIKNAKILESGGKRGAVILRMNNVHFHYGSRHVLRGVNLEVRRGEVLGIIGRNGSGKTTLAKIMAGIMESTSGKISRRVKTRDTGMVFQNPLLHVLGDSVREDIEATLKMRGEKGDVDTLLEYLGLKHLADRNPFDLSGGERLLFALGTVLVFKPKLLILDEPTRGLSWRYKKRVEKIVRDYSKVNSVVLISHDMEMIARLADRVALLSRGRVALCGEKREMLSSSLTFSTQLNKLAMLCESADRKVMIEEDLGV